MEKNVFVFVRPDEAPLLSRIDDDILFYYADEWYKFKDGGVEVLDIPYNFHIGEPPKESQFGAEWEKEMMRWTKAELVEELKKQYMKDAI